MANAMDDTIILSTKEYDELIDKIDDLGISLGKAKAKIQRSVNCSAVTTLERRIVELDAELKTVTESRDYIKHLHSTSWDHQQNEIKELETRVKFLNDKACENFESAVLADENLVCTQCGGLKSDGI
jgi:hypothetical protein